MRAAILLAVPLLVAGCAGPGPATDDEPDGAAPRAEAPWWNVGERWTIEFERAGQAKRATVLVNFANNTFGDPPHFWLGTASRKEALDHVFFEDNMFLGRIHWLYLAPHEQGRHSDMYSWPLVDGKVFDAHAFGRDWSDVRAEARPDGGFDIAGDTREGAQIRYDYDPATRWFSYLEVRDEAGAIEVSARIVEHEESGARGTYYFLRGRDYLDSTGGSTGKEERFRVEEEGATSIAFLMDMQATGPAALEFVAPNGEVVHREPVPLGGTTNKLVEVPRAPEPGDWTLRYVGTVSGTIKVRGIIEYKATL